MEKKTGKAIRKKRRNDMLIESVVCPKCGSWLQNRETDVQGFISCDNFHCSHRFIPTEEDIKRAKPKEDLMNEALDELEFDDEPGEEEEEEEE